MRRASSKLLSLVLRHRPELIGVTLDDGGWTDVDALVAALAAHGTPLTRAELDELVRSSDKQRFALSTCRRTSRPHCASARGAAGRGCSRSPQRRWLPADSCSCDPTTACGWWTRSRRRTSH